MKLTDKERERNIEIEIRNRGISKERFRGKYIIGIKRKKEKWKAIE